MSYGYEKRVDLTLTNGLLLFVAVVSVCCLAWLASFEYRLQRAASAMERGLIDARKQLDKFDAPKPVAKPAAKSAKPRR